jgi:GTP-binding protein
MLVDLPGYGYSKAPKGDRRRWARDIDTYLTGRESLSGVILVGDIRHFPTPSDLEALDWLRGLSKPLLVVLTKADKLGRGAVVGRLSDISGKLSSAHVQFHVFSAKTGQGRREVRSWIEKTAREWTSSRRGR